MKRRRISIIGLAVIVVLALSLVLTGIVSQAQRSRAVTNQKMAIPSYFYATSPYWTQLQGGAPTVGLAIINPGSGPGRRLDSYYLATTQATQAAGITVIGYTYTNYGGRKIANVKADIDKYYTWYGVNGIFFDEVSNSCAQLSYYQELYNYVKAKGGTAKVVINPGINTEECYINAADIIVNFEDLYTAYVNWAPSGWEFNYPADRFWQLVIATSAANMPNAVALSKNRNAGWLYVTDDVMNNPWDTLPANPYWTNELTLISQ